LTGAKNRNALDDDFELCRRISARGEGLIVAIIDIDFFKHINDTYGHPTGDNYLRQLANLYRKHVRRVGDSLIRMGGEEFLMLLANTTMQEGKEHLRRLQQEVEQMNLTNERCQNRSQTVSIGAVWVAPDILRCNQGSEFFIRLYKNADQLLYTAKSDGRNQLKLTVLRLR
jgi:diguanylate cyclase (GGDEF)-like protein